jgi:dihydroflavonol-4-reductase
MPVTLKGRMNVVDAHDVAWGTVQALEKGRKGRVYVLGGENVTLPGFTARVARLAGARSAWLALDPELLLPAAWLSEWLGKSLRLSSPPLPVVGIDFARFGEFISSEVARRELGYQPGTTPISASIRLALAWFRQNGLLPSRRNPTMTSY